MKILIILGGFFPAQTYGGPTVSINNLCSLLGDIFDFYILTSDHELHDSKRLQDINDGWNDRSNCKVKYLRQDENNGKTYREIVDEIEPDIIYLNSLFSIETTVPFLRLAKKKKIPLLLAPRGELCVNAFNKKYKKIPYLMFLYPYLKSHKVWYQSTSEEETIQLRKILRIPEKRILSLTNVPFIPTIEGKEVVKERGSCKLVFLARIEAKKNLHFALNVLGNVKQQVTFDIYGPKEDMDYWEKCDSIIRYLPSNIQVNYCGAIPHDLVSKTFSSYHGFFFPTISENYGHVLVESMLVGCPVITSDQVPWQDVNEDASGWSISLNNPQLFTNVIEIIAAMDQAEFNALSERCLSYIKKRINLPSLRDSYINAFQQIFLS